MLRSGTEGYAVKEVKLFAVAAFQPAGIGAPFGENFSRDDNAIAGIDGPQSFIEHPVSIACEGEAVVWVVVAAF